MSTIQGKSNTENQAKNQAAGLHKITIVGGGAGGLELAVRLGKKLGKKRKQSSL